MNRHKLGLFFGASSYTLWGLFPLYWPLVKPANPLEIVSHRAVWSLVFCLIALYFFKQFRETLEMFRTPTVVLRFALASALISVNWITYIWAVNHQHIVEASLGYYMQPIILVSLGVLVFKEKMRKPQWWAFGIATVGVVVLTFDFGRPPWVSFLLAGSWGSYSLVKKQLNLGALQGLAIETFISLPFYGGYLIYLALHGTGQFGHGAKLTTLLIGAGVVTAVPLLLFNGATTRLPFTMIGLLQYLTPTIQFALAVWLRHEPMPSARWIGFVFIWVALIVLGRDLIKSSGSVDNSLAQPD
jgi:chloramphenicol-sensitive protein RarD